MWAESSCAFPKSGTATGSRRALEQWRPTARQKRSYLYHQSEFQHNYFDFVSLHHSDHDGVVRIFVGHSEIVKRLLINYIIYAAQFFLYQECNNYITRHNFLYTRSVIRLHYITRHNFSPTRSVIYWIIYAAQFFPYQECNMLFTRHNFSPTRSVM